MLGFAGHCLCDNRSAVPDAAGSHTQELNEGGWLWSRLYFWTLRSGVHIILTRLLESPQPVEAERLSLAPDHTKPGSGWSGPADQSVDGPSEETPAVP